MKLGAVGLTERFLTSDPPRGRQLKELRSEIEATLEDPVRKLREYKWEAATGTSGTILAVAAGLRHSSTNGKASQNGSMITLKDLAQWNAAISVMNVKERREFAGLSVRRAEIIIAGAQILEGTMRALGIKSLQTCDWSLREGVIIDRLQQRKTRRTRA